NNLVALRSPRHEQERAPGAERMSVSHRHRRLIQILTVACATAAGLLHGRYSWGSPELARTLNRAADTTAAYARAVEAWSEDRPIWPSLGSPEARLGFLRFVLRSDDTDARPYASFGNLCTGFSAQMYARYSSRSRLK